MSRGADSDGDASLVGGEFHAQVVSLSCRSNAGFAGSIEPHQLVDGYRLIYDVRGGMPIDEQFLGNGEACDPLRNPHRAVSKRSTAAINAFRPQFPIVYTEQITVCDGEW